jgi:hypothetical protein
MHSKAGRTESKILHIRHIRYLPECRTTPLQRNTFRGRAALGARLYNTPHTPFFRWWMKKIFSSYIRADSVICSVDRATCNVLTWIQEVPIWNPRQRESRLTEVEVKPHGFPPSLQASSGKLHHVTSQQPPVTSFPVHYSRPSFKQCHGSNVKQTFDIRRGSMSKPRYK